VLQTHSHHQPRTPRSGVQQTLLSRCCCWRSLIIIEQQTASICNFTPPRRGEPLSFETANGTSTAASYHRRSGTSSRVCQAHIATKHPLSAIHRCEHQFELHQPLGVHHTHHSVASFALAAPLMSPRQSESSSTAQDDPSRAPATFHPQPLASTR
jgi:hypothetical protein